MGVVLSSVGDCGGARAEGRERVRVPASGRLRVKDAAGAGAGAGRGSLRGGRFASTRAVVRRRSAAARATAPKSFPILEAGPSGGQSGGYASASQCVRMTERTRPGREPRGPTWCRGRSGRGPRLRGPERSAVLGGAAEPGRSRPSVRGWPGGARAHAPRAGQARSPSDTRSRGRGRRWGRAIRCRGAERSCAVRRRGGGAPRLAASARGGPRRRARPCAPPTRARRGRPGAPARGRRGRRS